MYSFAAFHTFPGVKTITAACPYMHAESFSTQFRKQTKISKVFTNIPIDTVFTYVFNKVKTVHSAVGSATMFSAVHPRTMRVTV